MISPRVELVIIIPNDQDDNDKNNYFNIVNDNINIMSTFFKIGKSDKESSYKKKTNKNNEIIVMIARKYQS